MEVHNNVNQFFRIEKGTGKVVYGKTKQNTKEHHIKENDTIIIAPYFQATDDPALSDELQWSSSGWKIGNKSVDKAGLTRTSSFQVMDEMIASLSNQVKFPALVDIVVTGHSAGGQFTQRYAAGGKADLTDTMHRYKYVVANPSSYLYLDGYRAVPGDITQFSIVAITSFQSH